ncbi:MAG: ABC transporter substrate-binding protein, partial [Pseudomonadota bacterium]
SVHGSDECSGRNISSEHILGGKACVPESPERIITLDPFYTLLMALDLDASVIATALSGRDLPTQVTADLDTVGQRTAPNLEAILAQEPDLIIGQAYGQERLLPRLAGIAPSVLIDTSDWRVYFKTLAKAVGQAEKAEAALAEFEVDLKATARDLPKNQTVSFLRIVPGGFQVYVAGPNAYAPVSLLTELGLERPPYETVTDGTVLRRPSLEGLLELRGDTLIYTIGGAHHEGDSEALEAEVTSSAIWRVLPAVQSGRAFRVEPTHWMGFGGIVSAREILADIRRIYDLPEG